MISQQVQDYICEERQRQVEKFGDQFDSHDFRWLTILTEEVGEAAEASLDLNDPGDDLQRGGTTERQMLREEIIQVATVAAAWADALDVRPA